MIETDPRSGAGPLVWLGIIASTCLLLAMLQKVLWLVVPFLLALVLYYLLQPAMQRLMYRGFGRDQAAALVMSVFMVLLVAYAVIVLPVIAASLLDWQNSLMRYLHGGIGLLEKTVRGLEYRFGFLASEHLADQVSQRIADATGDAGQYVEPLVKGLIAWAPSLLLAPFLAFFFLRDGGRFQRMLSSAVPNAFFEKTLYLMHEVDRTTRAYFQGLLKLTLLDTVTLAAGLWWIGLPAPFTLGLVCAVLAWLPFIGSVLGGVLVVLVAATDFPTQPEMAYGAVALFLLVRLLDDFVYMPLTIGKSLHMHPMLTVLMIFVGGAVAGIPGLMLVLPLLGVVMVIGETIGKVLTDPRLIARYQHGRQLRRRLASLDLDR